MGSSKLRVFHGHMDEKPSSAFTVRELPLPTFDVPYFKYIDEEDEWSSRSQSSTEDDSVDSLLSDRYMVVSGTPEKILEHLLNDLHLDEVQDKETGTIQKRNAAALLLFRFQLSKSCAFNNMGTENTLLYYTRLEKIWCSYVCKAQCPTQLSLVPLEHHIQ